MVIDGLYLNIGYDVISIRYDLVYQRVIEYVAITLEVIWPVYFSPDILL